MKIPQEKFDEIAQANDIIDVINSYTSVKKRGKSFVALCPFHPDKNPSLHISPQKQVYHCFACGASGNIFTFVKEYEKVTFIEAIQKLALRAGIDLNIHEGKPDLSNEISRLFEINKQAARYYHESLMNLSGGEKEFIWGYLKKRGIEKETIKKFGIGYSKKSWNALQAHFTDDGNFKTEDVEKAGLIIRSDSDSKRYYDRFRGRLMFPIFNESEKVVGFGGRKMFEDDPGGKYINSPETRIYNKSRILYGLNFSKESIRLKDSVILVEGYIDLITLVTAGITNVVASSGTALTEEQVQLISRYTKNVVIIFDADTAGIKAAKRGIETVLEGGLDLQVVSLPENEDPDSFIRKKGKKEFEKLLNGSKSIIQFISSLYEKEQKLITPEQKAEFVKEIISYIVRIPDKIKIAFYMKEIATMYKLYESDLRDELNSAYRKYKRESYPKSSLILPAGKPEPVTQKKEKIPQAEIDLLDVLVNGDVNAISSLENNINIEYITDKAIADLVDRFMNQLLNDGVTDVNKLMNEVENKEARALLGRLATPKHEVSRSEQIPRNSLLLKAERSAYNYVKIATDVIKQLEINYLERKINEIKGNEEKLPEIALMKKKIQELRKNVK